MTADHVFHRALGRPRAIRAEGCTITTEDGRTYLDGAGGAIACSIGHAHPDVLAAMTDQAAALDYVHATQFESAALRRLAARVASITPIPDARVFPVSGGSEANETAFKLARAYHLARGDADRHVVIARSAAYHGNSRGALDASDRESLRAGYEPWLGRTVRVAAVNPYRDGRTGGDHAEELARTIETVGAERVAAFVAEPVAGATLAAVVPAADYWPAVAEVCRRHGVLLIADEVMTGFGRTGRWWGLDHWGVVPDIATAGKGASGGYWPLGLVVASGAVYETVTKAANFVHGFTWSHHPIGAAVASTVIDVIERDGLVDRARVLGERAHERLDAELGEHRNVGDVRGLGLLRAVELVADRETRTPFDRAAGTTERIVAAAFELGLTIYPCTSAVDGRTGDALMLGPPLTVSEGQLDEMVARLVVAIRTVLPG